MGDRGFPVVHIFLLLGLLLLPAVQAKEIALTYDDCPMADGEYYTGVRRTQVLTRKLKTSKVPSVGFFCTTRHLDATGRRRLKMYSDAGHIIGNHTALHPDFHKTETADYIASIEAAHAKLKDFATFRKWFRFPYLREGETVEKRDALRAYLKRAGYTSGYVTVDTYDWYMNSLFQKALETGKKVDFTKLEKMYTKVLTEGADFYDAIAQRALGYSPRHVMLLHENDLAALYVDKLVKQLRGNGWKIISIESAYEDPIAKEEPDTLLLGQGRVVALAKAKGDPGPFWKWEDEAELDKLFEEEQVFQ